jgi:hypothetical protein
MSTSRHTQLSPGEAEADLVDATGIGLRIVEVGLVILIALMVAPPLLVLAVVVVVPTAVVLLAVATVFAVIAAPVVLVRRVHNHHRSHGSTVFLHRVNRREAARLPAAARQLGKRLAGHPHPRQRGEETS